VYLGHRGFWLLLVTEILYVSEVKVKTLMMKNEIWTRNALRDKISACFELIVYTYISKDIYGHA